MSSPRSQLLAASDTDSTTQIVALVGAGKAALAEGDLDTALEYFEQVVDRFPEQAEGHNNLGSLYTALGDFARAEKCFSHVLKLMPDHPNVHYNRGVARIRLEQTDGAIADFDAVLASQPDDTEALNNKGVALFMQGHFGRATDALRQALAHRPDYPQAVLNLCDCLVAADDISAAIAACERYLVANADPEVRRHSPRRGTTRRRAPSWAACSRREKRSPPRPDAQAKPSAQQTTRRRLALGPPRDYASARHTGYRHLTPKRKARGDCLRQRKFL